MMSVLFSHNDQCFTRRVAVIEMATCSEDDLLAIVVILDEEEEEVEVKKQMWVHQAWQNRGREGEFATLYSQLTDDGAKFYEYFRMSENTFNLLLKKMEDYLQKRDNHWRKAITAREGLAVCLRYLATGNSYQTIAFSFRLGRLTVSNIVRDVCREIWNVLQPIYMPPPTTQTWKEAAEGFSALWGFLNCVGSKDGKHIKLKYPNNSGSEYYCYKDFFFSRPSGSGGPFYKFIVVDIGSYGRHSDSVIFENSALYRQYIDGNTILPPKPLPGTNTPMPHVIVSDEGFALQTYLMRPYPKVGMINPKKKMFQFTAQSSPSCRGKCVRYIGHEMACSFETNRNRCLNCRLRS
ncbi:uncharacterized protein LOC134527499 [Bacillus rossius redtenbacheri]|uniref:uncharacterized protein LOC134527499 n=1 Tax=Bacillus rossius redtenbacheri TaxID=93214 RepID=UPI002FDEC30D